MRSPEELRTLVEEHLGGLELHAGLGELEAAVRYALEGGGKRIRPVLCLATTEAAGGNPADALDAAAAVELIHSFSLVHDDLPALDDDDERRGRPTVHVRFGEAQAILAGDALLNEAFALALRYPGLEVGRELARATSGMLSGQYLELNGGSPSRVDVNRLKTAALFEASVGCGLSVAGLASEQQVPWRAFGGAYGSLFQAVDDLVDADGLVEERGPDETRLLVDELEANARTALATTNADTSVLAELVDQVVARVP
jgi:geranylgeranyl diphosphate synthase, type II